MDPDSFVVAIGGEFDQEIEFESEHSVCHKRNYGIGDVECRRTGSTVGSLTMGLKLLVDRLKRAFK